MGAVPAAGAGNKLGIGLTGVVAGAGVVVGVDKPKFGLRPIADPRPLKN